MKKKLVAVIATLVIVLGCIALVGIIRPLGGPGPTAPWPLHVLSPSECIVEVAHTGAIQPFGGPGGLLSYSAQNGEM